MLRFLGSDLRPVLLEATANRCRLNFVRDKGGVYLMSEKGEADASGRRKVVAYAVGCNPDVDEFDVWWQSSAKVLGGDSFSTYWDITNPVLLHILKGNWDLTVQAFGPRQRLFLTAATPLERKR